MCCLCIQFTNENTSERKILHLVKQKFPDPLFQVWLLALQKRLATPLIIIAVNPSRRSINNTILGSPPSNVAPVKQTQILGNNYISVQLKSRLAKILIFRSVEYLKIQGR